MPTLFPILIDSEDLGHAWPLARLAQPALSLSDWIAHGRRHLGRGVLPQRGFLGLSCDRGYLFALVAFTRMPDVGGAVLLVVEPIARADLALGEDPATTMLDALLAFARLVGCARLRLQLRHCPGFFSPTQLAAFGFVEKGDNLERTTALNGTDPRPT